MTACIWVDADACPKVVREILFRAAQRTGIELTMVANQSIATPASANIRSLQVPQGFVDFMKATQVEHTHGHF